MRTLRAIDEAGQDLRLWCFRCGRGARVDAIIWRLFEARDWAQVLPMAARRFRCTGCGSSDQVALYPARRPNRAPASGASVIAGYFHRCRAAAKHARRDRRT
jgi:hypothetical protein